jgi:predicted nucleotidyltransferase
MQEHHAKALEKAKARLLENSPDILAIILGGSIAKGVEREDSDVDLIVVLTDEHYLKSSSDNRVAFLWNDVCDYEGGYVEGRFVSRSFIMEAARRGSEPTRHSFTGAYPIYCVDAEIENCLPSIPVYPSERQSENITAFLAQMQLNRWFFWSEGKRRGDLYLQTRAATEIVLFGCHSIEEFVSFSGADLLSRFLQDIELSWYHQTHAISEW